MLVNVLLTLVSFVVAIGILVAVHEWGHFAMARACGVKVLRFSVGFGPRIAGWTSQRTGTDYVVGALPLGGYVKMLDERDGVVAPEERRNAFNLQPLAKRGEFCLPFDSGRKSLARFVFVKLPDAAEKPECKKADTENPQ